MHGHAYVNYTNCIYRALFGKNAAQLRDAMGLGPSENLRDRLSREELETIQSMERLVSGLVDFGWGGMSKSKDSLIRTSLSSCLREYVNLDRFRSN